VSTTNGLDRLLAHRPHALREQGNSGSPKVLQPCQDTPRVLLDDLRSAAGLPAEVQNWAQLKDWAVTNPCLNISLPYLLQSQARHCESVMQKILIRMPPTSLGQHLSSLAVLQPDHPIRRLRVVLPASTSSDDASPATFHPFMCLPSEMREKICGAYFGDYIISFSQNAKAPTGSFIYRSSLSASSPDPSSESRHTGTLSNHRLPNWYHGGYYMAYARHRTRVHDRFDRLPCAFARAHLAIALCISANYQGAAALTLTGVHAPFYDERCLYKTLRGRMFPIQPPGLFKTLSQTGAASPFHTIESLQIRLMEPERNIQGDRHPEPEIKQYVSLGHALAEETPKIRKLGVDVDKTCVITVAYLLKPWLIEMLWPVTHI
jgi:hypothetical protein